MKKNEQAHFDDDCIQVETQCEFCNAAITKADEFNHLNVCKEFVVPCPNGCGKTEMRRADVLFFKKNLNSLKFYKILNYIRFKAIWKTIVQSMRSIALSVIQDAHLRL